MIPDFTDDVHQALVLGADNRQLPFFVYGTLKPGGSNFNRLIIPTAITNQTPATLEGASLYTDGTYPYITLAPNTIVAGEVKGFLLRFSEVHYKEHLSKIDDLEQYSIDWPTQNCWYLRKVVSVRITTDELVEAWVYVAGPTIAAAIEAGKLTRIPDGNWGL